MTTETTTSTTIGTGPETKLVIAPATATSHRHEGSCHCGTVRYRVEIDLATARASRCNCSVCTKIAPTGGLVKPAAFELLAGEDSLSRYVWGSGMSTRFFCKHCGVHCFGRGELAQLGGAFVSVNLNTLDGIEPLDLHVVYWDGRHDNWQSGPRSAPWRIGGEGKQAP